MTPIKCFVFLELDTRCDKSKWIRRIEQCSNLTLSIVYLSPPSNGTSSSLDFGSSPTSAHIGKPSIKQDEVLNRLRLYDSDFCFLSALWMLWWPSYCSGQMKMDCSRQTCTGRTKINVSWAPVEAKKTFSSSLPSAHFQHYLRSQWAPPSAHTQNHLQLTLRTNLSSLKRDVLQLSCNF